ncbi:uncharacterized protein PGTG_13151 [Puccinia graminis f. sp. tritici CRL 75-36-700-3]|uniref:Uncharacterized protein n=1 Tax=Puccinia graminis f. sp. tritici (strain CRL 75-36-700-3 / race SCCL) TaxID=418459 RepID=E3KR44_PUCGT|nr:uncharacterized protein PGTG_13151 [Puccinia graminis f. sp. tritici CRL 75-36-700-3]EFP86769.2 hypothetical protein PGTG_13151 [Puccinia graminis f. sp. tritici CRL 75-36-700-3]
MVEGWCNRLMRLEVIALDLLLLGYVQTTPPWTPRAGLQSASPPCLYFEPPLDIGQSDVFQELQLPPLNTEPVNPHNRGFAQEFADDFLTSTTHQQHLPSVDPDGLDFHDWMERLLSENNQEESLGRIGSTGPITASSPLIVSNELKDQHSNTRVKRPSSAPPRKRLGAEEEEDEEEEEVDHQSTTEPTQKSRRMAQQEERGRLMDSRVTTQADIARREEDWIISIERRAARKLLSHQDPADGVKNAEFKRQLSEKMDEIRSHANTFLKDAQSETMASLPITFTRRQAIFGRQDFFKVLIRLCSPDKSLVPLRKHLEPRILRLLRAMTMYHNWLNFNNADRKILGKLNAHNQLVDWFWTLLFERSYLRFPLMGWVASEYPPKDPPKFFRSPVQKYLINLLVRKKRLDMKDCFEAAIKLISYWYEDLCSTNLNSSNNLEPPLFFLTSEDFSPRVTPRHFDRDFYLNLVAETFELKQYGRKPTQ